MALQRSQSVAVKDVRARRESKDDTHVVLGHIADQRKSRAAERPKTAEARKSSFSRPRTANSAADRTAGSLETIPIHAGGNTYNFPTPSPRLAPKTAVMQMPPVPSPLASDTSPAIGVAIGSPSQGPPPKWGRSYTANAVWDRQPTADPPARPTPAATYSHGSLPQQPELRRKKSSWKAIGNLFARKPSKSATQEPFYKVKITEAEFETMARQPATLSPNTQDKLSPRAHVHQRSPSMTRGLARFEARKEADLAQFHPEFKTRKTRSPSMIQKDGFSPMFKALGSQRESEEMFSPSTHERVDSPLSTGEKLDGHGLPKTPRLDLDLPTPGFDRYSVMFEKVLEDPKPSLLERRQIKVQRMRSSKGLEPIRSITPPPESPLRAAEDNTQLPQRSATSPGLRSRLALRLSKKDGSSSHPTAPHSSDTTAIHRPRPILRSNTAPPGSQSPTTRHYNLAVTKPPIGSGLTSSSQTFRVSEENSLPPTPNTINTTASSPVAIVQPVLGQPEPSWDMLTSNALTPEKHRRREPYPRVKSPEDLEKQIVQVSVARQVSVSKARRQVQYAHVSKQPLRPRVVELGKEKARKSTVGVLETSEV